MAQNALKRSISQTDRLKQLYCNFVRIRWFCQKQNDHSVKQEIPNLQNISKNKNAKPRHNSKITFKPNY